MELRPESWHSVFEYCRGAEEEVGTDTERHINHHGDHDQQTDKKLMDMIRTTMQNPA